MSWSIREIVERHRGEAYDLLRAHVNPQFARVLKTIGFDRTYVRAEGPYLWDAAGNRYLDFLGGYAVVNVGRNHPTVKRALEEVLAMHPPGMVQFDAPVLAGVLAAELKRRIGRDLDKAFFTNSGTEGIEAAIKFARCTTGREGLVFAEKAFHGLSTGSLSLNGCESFREGFGTLLNGAARVPYNDLPALEAALAGGGVAAFVVEPIQGKGVNVPSPGYLAGAAALCRAHGTLLVIDEVQTGVGRTGSFLAIDQEDGGVGRVGGGGGIQPDIIVMSKALSGGYVPVGAVLMTRRVYEAVYSSMDRAIVHSSTFHQGPLAMAAALASLQALDEGRMVENSRIQGERLMAGLRAMQPRYEFMKEVRGRGLMIGIQFGQPRSRVLRTGWSMIHALDRNLFTQAVVLPLMDDHRILTQVAGHNIDVLKLTPPLVIGEEDVREFLHAFEAVMDRLHSFPGPVWEVMKKLGKNVITQRPRETARV